MRRDLAIDLGTANTLVFESGRGLILNEPSVTAINRENGRVLAMGNQAWEMIGRAPGYVVAERPLRRGAISDFDTTERYIRLVLQKAGVRKLARLRVLLSIPSAATEVERRAVRDAAMAAGARAAYLIEEPVAAAIGAGLPISEPVGNFIVDIGGGTTEVGVLAMGGMVVKRSVRVGGFDIDEAIARHIRETYSMVVGDRTAEQIKLAVASAFPLAAESEAEVHGRDLETGLPKVQRITTGEIRTAIAEPVAQMLQTILSALAETPPDMSQDVLDRGIAVTGGGSLLKGLGMRIAEECDVPVHQSDRPMESVALGAGKCLGSLHLLKDLMASTN